MVSSSFFSTASFKSFKSDSILDLSSALILSPCSFRFFSTSKVKLFAWFFTSTSSLFCLSDSAFASASFTILSISSSDNPPEAWILICCSLPVDLSLAETLTMPLASISKVTSTWGVPLGAGGMPTKSN